MMMLKRVLTSTTFEDPDGRWEQPSLRCDRLQRDLGAGQDVRCIRWISRQGPQSTVQHKLMVIVGSEGPNTASRSQDLGYKT